MSNLVELENINPFVRYVHVFGTRRLQSTKPYAACDNRCFLVRRGAMELVLAEGLCRVEAGQLILIPAGCPYNFSVAEDTEVLGINFDYTQQGAKMRAPIVPVLADQLEREDLLEDVCISDYPELQKPLHLRNAVGLFTLAEELDAEYASARALSAGILSAKMKLLLMGVAECLHADSRACETVDRVIAFVRLHCTERISNHDVGQALSFHPNYLNRLMQRHTGKSLHAYLVHCRINHAIRLLQTTTLPIGEIAMSSGFGDVQQFSKIFRQSTGQTPGEFRKSFI